MYQKFTAVAYCVVLGFCCWSYPSLTFAQDENNADSTKADKSPQAVEEVNPVAVKNGVAKLSPANSKVEFIGIHVGDDPKPRLGGFSEFEGQLKLNEDGKTVSQISIEFQMASVWTEFPNLTQHLQNADFFEVEKYPTSKFVSTKIAAGEKPGEAILTGDLTLHGTTKEISFPANVQVDEKGVVLKSEFKLDRTSFGMDKKTDGVVALVTVNVSIGESTTSRTAQGTPSQRPAGGGMNPAAFFKDLDKDSDGKLTGDEIPNRMKERMSSIDTDGDGAVTLEEIQARFQQRGNRSDR